MKEEIIEFQKLKSTLKINLIAENKIEKLKNANIEPEVLQQINESLNDTANELIKEDVFLFTKFTEKCYLDKII